MITAKNRDALLGELLCIADTKWVLGHWYVKVILNGRSVPDFSSMAGMAQDELGHTRAMLGFLEQSFDLPEHQLEFGREATEIHSMALLDEAPENWADFVITCYLAEHALWSALEGYVGGSYRPVTNFCTKFAEEGYFHRLYIDGWLGALADDELEQARAALAKRIPLARNWFVGTETEILKSEGIRPWSLAECAQHFEEAMRGLAKILDVKLPKPGSAPSEWDAVRRRPQDSAMPATLWEYMVPTSKEAVVARRPLAVSVQDNIDLFGKPKIKDETAPFFDQ